MRSIQRHPAGQSAELRPIWKPLLTFSLLLVACRPSDQQVAPSASAPQESSAPPVAASPAAPDTVFGWRTTPLRVRRDTEAVATVIGARAARHAGFDRFVLEFAGDTLPGYLAEYLTGPATQCGSGDRITVAGEAVLLIHVEPAYAHDDSGRVTLSARTLQPDLPALLEARLVCDFEAQVEWVLGVSRQTGFRVRELVQPARLIVDIRH